MNETYKYVKKRNSELFKECVARAAAIANNTLYGEGKPNEITLAAAIESNMMELIYKAYDDANESLH